MENATLYASSKSRWTDEELMVLPRDGRKHELLDGDLLMSPVSVTHSLVCVRLAVALAEFVQRRKLGEVFDSSIGFRLSADVVLSPDVSFVTKARMRKLFVAPDQFLAGSPDLVVEVLSPSDRVRLVERKLDRYFEGGTLLAWLVDWKKRQVHTYAPDKVQALTRPQDFLTGGQVLPGFKCKLSRLFHP